MFSKILIDVKNIRYKNIFFFLHTIFIFFSRRNGVVFLNREPIYHISFFYKFEKYIIFFFLCTMRIFRTSWRKCDNKKNKNRICHRKDLWKYVPLLYINEFKKRFFIIFYFVTIFFFVNNVITKFLLHKNIIFFCRL